MARPKKNINNIVLADKAIGKERQRDIANMPLTGTMFTPKPVSLKDMDDAFLEWAKTMKIVNEDGIEFPTFSLYSNQRFSEYFQTWSHTDKNENLLLNFKTVTRDSNPQYGNIHKRLWNIPGTRFYSVKKFVVLDDNGTESFLNIGMRQPMSVDLKYILTVYTNKFQQLNSFNTLINKHFQSRQCYLAPNGYYMPMILDNVGDESEYSLDDRQFYSQSYTITLMGYVLEEKDFSVTEEPLKRSANFGMTIRKKADVDVGIEYCDSDDDAESKQMEITLVYPRSVKDVEFEIDTDFTIDGFNYDNLAKACFIHVNGDEVAAKPGTYMREGDKVRVSVRHRDPKKEGTLVIKGHNPNEL